MLLEENVPESNILEVIGCIDENKTPQKIIDETINKFSKVDVLVKF